MIPADQSPFAFITAHGQTFPAVRDAGDGSWRSVLGDGYYSETESILVQRVAHEQPATPEPMLLGAIAQDAGGRVFVRCTTVSENSRWHIVATPGMQFMSWSQIEQPVKVLFAGVDGP